MRSVIVCILLFVVLLNVPAFGQRLHLVNKKLTMVQFFKELKRQTGYNVIWNEKKFDADKIIEANFQNAGLKEVLDKAFEGLSLTYIINGKMIIIKQKEILGAANITAIDVKGIVLNELGEPLEGATVKVKTGEKTTVTNTKGEYLLYGVDTDAILLLSYLGYKTAEISADKTLKKTSLMLSTDKLQEIEIVSTGYQQIPKRKSTGSFELIDDAQLERRISSDIFSRLEGITSGLLFNKNTVSANAGGLDLSIRGRSTIFANDQPLIILDNFAFNGDFNSINPNDIANITLLKDAAAAAIWGVRAGNGVIVITTKRGKAGQPLKVALNSNVSVSAKPDVFYNPNYLSSTDFIDIETFLFNEGKYDDALADGTGYPVVSSVIRILNNQRNGLPAETAKQQIDALRKKDIRNEEFKYFYRNAIAQQYSLALSGSLAKSAHYFSVGYDKTKAALIGNHNDRLTINSQNSFHPIKNLELEAGLYYVGARSVADSTLSEVSGVNFLPYNEFKDANGQALVLDRDFSASFKQDALERGFLDWTYTPLNELGKSPLKTNNNDLRINGSIKYTIVPGLSAAIKYQYQHIDAKAGRHNSMDSYQTRNLINQYSILTSDRVSGYNIPLGGIFYSVNGKALSNSLRTQIEYQKNWNEHEVSAIAGYEISEFTSDLREQIRYGYNSATGEGAKVDTTSYFNLNPVGLAQISANNRVFGKVDRMRSLFANAAYTYRNRYTLSGSARIDGSNYFGVKTNQKYVPLWSAGALWNIDREPFYHFNWLPVLRLRASYGYNGNLDKGNTGITTFKYALQGAGFTNLPFASIINIGNPELKWERVGIANFGIDFGLKDQVFAGKIEYYFKNGSDILGDKPFPSNTGINTLRGNYSKMKTRGFDVTLTSRNLTGKLGWTTSFVFSTARDWVTSYDVLQRESIYYVGGYNDNPVLGKPVYGVYSYKWAGLDPLNGDPRGYVKGEISKDYNALVNTSTIDDLEYNGPARPTIFGGLSNTFSYHKFTLSFNISYKFGYYFRKPTVDYYAMFNYGLGAYMNNDFTKRWKNVGDELITNVPSIGEYDSDNLRDEFYKKSSATVDRGDHIRLQDINLSYELGNLNLAGVALKQFRLYFYTNNLGIIWKANDFGLDPDAISRTGDRFSNPISKNFVFGLKAYF